MGNYAKAALAAYGLVVKDLLDPLDAWNKAIFSITSSEASRNKSCPRITFLSLASCGYLKGVNAYTFACRGRVLRERAIAAAELVLANPEATHRYLSDNLKHSDKQGSYDIVIQLAKSGILRTVR